MSATEPELRRWTVITLHPVGAQRSWRWYDHLDGDDGALNDGELAGIEGAYLAVDPGDGSLHVWEDGAQGAQLYPAPPRPSIEG